MSDTHKTKTWYVQVAVENGKKLQRGFKQRSKDRYQGLHYYADRTDWQAAIDAEAEELGTDDPWSGASKRFAAGKHKTEFRRQRTKEKRGRVKQQIKSEDFDAIDNRGTERHDADWYD